MLTLLLSACMPENPATEAPTEEIAIETKAAVVTEESVAMEEPIEIEAPTEPTTEEPLICVELLTPENAIEVPAVGKVTFEWTALEGADTYLLTFTPPNDEIITFETDDTTRDRYMEAFVQNGEYQWTVTALAGDRNQICSSDFFIFTKPTSENAPQVDGGVDGPPPPGIVIEPPIGG